MSRPATRLRCVFALGLILACSPLAAAVAQDAPASFVSPDGGAADTLRPGQYRWHPEAAPEGPVSIVVSLPLQRAYVYRAGILIGVSTVSSGQPGHDTPTGSFHILQKEVDHHSSLYNDAPMPFMQRLTWDGVALHAGAIPERPASHGCVRLPRGFARLLYGVTELGASVVITDVAPAAPEEALTLAAAS